jgi:linoleoyl-CoA desaturase
MSLDLVGGSSYIWRWKHNLFHHSYPNIAGADEDIDLVPFAHLAPEQPRYAVHRFQHLYVWVLYCLLPLQWHFVSDFRNLIRGTIGGHSFSRPRGGELFLLLGGKIVFFGLAFVLPALFHSWWAIALCYGLTAAVLGLTLSIVFQLAHCVEEASFTQPIAGTSRMQNSWMVHQIESSVDFGRSNKLLTWYLGGLNFQIEHHLFPTICHFHYPALSPIVEGVCGEFDVRYFAHVRAYDAVVSHYRFLKLDRS